jgi:tetratricopeptide (TPR) repeat protein
MVAQALLERAVAIEPNYGQALGVLAASQIFGAHNGWSDIATTVPSATRAAIAAVRSDNKDPWAHHAMGCVHLFARRFDDSLAEFELALRLNPNFSLAQSYYGLALSTRGRWREAVKAVDIALRLSPGDPFAAHYYGVAAYAEFAGRNYAEAMQFARMAIHLRTDFVAGHRIMAAAAAMAGEAETAMVAIRELRRAHPDVSLAWIADRILIEHEIDRQHYLEAFRRAGLD